jgi:hypothetical protein
METVLDVLTKVDLLVIPGNHTAALEGIFLEGVCV